MSLVVNYNDSAFNAHRNLQGTDRMLKGSIQRLSSGLRVNNAADDPAGLVISQQMRGLAVHAANTAVNSDEAVAADQAQLDKAVESIDRIASTTKFNGKPLLDGTYTSQIFQVGANANDTLVLTIDNTNATTLGVASLDLATAATAAITAIDAAVTTVSTTRSTLGSFQ